MVNKNMTDNFFDSKELMSRTEREDYLNQKLIRMVNLGYQKSQRFKEILDNNRVDPSKIISIKDLQKIPVISREQFVKMEAEVPPFGGFYDNDIRPDIIFTSPGPVHEPYFPELEQFWARGYFAAGFRQGDIVLNTFSYHMVAAGLTFHNGLRRLGITVVPSGTSSTDSQVQLIKNLNITGYTGTPSFLMAIIKKAEDIGHDFKEDFKIRRACFVAEPLEPSLREKFEREYLIDTYQMYGATEVGDIAYECNFKEGWHICEDTIVEIVDPTNGENVAFGEVGEVVVTRLNDVFFLFRFGTGDLSSLSEEVCPCGRTSFRLGGISGRVGEAVKIRGMFVTPSQLKLVASKLGNPRFQVVIDRSLHKDKLTVMIEIPAEGLDTIRMQTDFEKVFREVCTVKVDNFEFVKELKFSEMDKFIIDRRNWK